MWQLDGNLPQPLPGTATRTLLLVPAEDVLTLAVPLPLPSHARRLAALPYAIEDRIAERVDAVHCALSAQRVNEAWIAAIVAPQRMQSWLMAAEEAGIGDAALMPDALAVPVPPAGRWHILRRRENHILARLPDGTGFAALQSTFEAVWTAAGKPPCTELAGFDAIVPILIDLRQGVFARPRQRMSQVARRFAVVGAAGLLAHGAIAAADTFALRSVADQRGAELLTLVDMVAPGRITTTDPGEAAMQVADLLPTGSSDSPGTLLPMLSRTSAALAPFGSMLTVRSLEFDESRNQLLLGIFLSDPAVAPNIEAALGKAGLAGRFDKTNLIITARAAS